MTSPFMDAQGNTIPGEQVLGSGGSAVVILQDGVAIKAPLRYPWSTPYDVQSSIDSIRREQDVYRRLQQPQPPPALADDARASGVVRCVRFAPEAIHLEHMPNGDLKAYLAKTRPSPELQLRWCLEMARALDYVHERRVLVADVASRNLLLDAGLSLKLCDFSEASLLPSDTDMSVADDKGYTAQVDVGLLGAVMYEVATGTRCAIDLYKDNEPADGRAYWPAREDLPDTRGLALLGPIIDGCWTGRFPSAGHLTRALEELCSSPAAAAPAPRRSAWLLDPDFVVQRRVMAIVGALSLAVYMLLAEPRRRS
ncbi:protein kinase [Cordyceps javanica]|uniref:Protein kinase n=1 Tax=Cordyceps javanica TaxID=43265 RepID=A0A545UUQ8_9HYPO|nr:protein kinase [Cordyceps javanica]TQW05442.1 protein kinase [Cordyceps javanica]